MLFDAARCTNRRRSVAIEGLAGEAVGGVVYRGERSVSLQDVSHSYYPVATPVQPQRVSTIRGEYICSMKWAISTTVLIIHNHPSGDPTPSPEDHELTGRLAAAGVVMGIDLVDHIVLGDSRYCSFKEMGKL
jgi:RadC-like JAB domain-containing protein